MEFSKKLRRNIVPEPASESRETASEPARELREPAS